MKKSLSVFVFALAGAAIQGQAAIISLNAPSHVTGAFDVTVVATGVFDAPHNGDALFGYGFDVIFDHSVLSYLGESAGPLFDDISNNPGLTADVGGVASAIFLQAGDFTEPLTLATLHFGVVGTGLTTISITADSSNLDQGLAYLSASDSFRASADVTPDVTTTPEPGTFLLSGLAALGVFALRGRRPKPAVS